MPSGGATKRPLLTGWLAVGVVDVHPMRGIGQKVDARAVLVDALHVVVSPHERRALRAHKVHLGAEGIRVLLLLPRLPPPITPTTTATTLHLQPLGLRLEHWPQVTLLVRAIPGC